MDQEGLYSSAIVQIIVSPKDIYTPRFSQDIYILQVSEDMGPGSLIGSVFASSLNSEDGARIVYKMITDTDGDESDNAADFRLDENSGNLYVAKVLDREKYELVSLYVSASEMGRPHLSDHAIVQIHLLDVNDNAPLFTRPSYEIQVHLGIKTGAFLGRVEAVDRDLGMDGTVRYSLNGSDILSIDPNTGIISLARALQETDQNFVLLTITATDLGQTPLVSTTRCSLRVIERQKMAPVFDEPFEFEVESNSAIGRTLGQIRARDPDYGVDADLTYKLLGQSDIFELKPSGHLNTAILVLKKTIGPEGRLFELKVRAYSWDMHSDCAIKVKVKDGPRLRVPPSFKVIFNNYKNYFLTDNAAFVPVIESEPSNALTFRLSPNIDKANK